MKDAFKKIIERLGKEHKLAEEDAERYDKGNSNHFKYAKARGYVNAMEVAIEIVKEVAEEYVTDINVGKNDGWIPCSERLPDDDSKEYIVQKTNGSIDILGFAKDAYKLAKYDFAEYKGKKKPIFYDYDPEYGYIEYECEAWMPLPAPYKPKGEK